MATLHVCLDCPVTKNPFLPSNSTICPRNSPKMAKNGPECAKFVSTSPKTEKGRILGYVARNQIPRVPSPSATPHFLWFPNFRITQRDA